MRNRMQLRHALLGAMIGFAGQLHAETLPEVIAATLTSNPDVLAAEARARASGHALRGAQSGYFPTLEATAGYGRETSDNSTTGVDRKMYRHESGAAFSQMLFDGWRTLGEEARAEAGHEGAGYGLANTRRSTMLRVVEVYLDVLSARELLRYAEENLALHQDIAEQIRRRSGTGISRRADVQQVEGREARSRSELIVAELTLRDAMARYLRVVGDLPEEMAPAVDADCAAIPDSMEATLNLAYERHPALQEAMAGWREAMAEERVALSAMMPSLHAEASVTKNDDVDGVDNINEDMLLMLRARYNLLNGGRDLARMREVRHLTDQAKARVESIRRQLEEQIRLSWHAFQAANIREPLLEERSVAMRETENAYSQQFQVGQRTLLDLLDVGSELFAANAEYAEIRYDRQLAGYRLLADIGVLEDLLDLPQE